MLSTYERNLKFFTFISMEKFKEAGVQMRVTFVWFEIAISINILEEHVCEKMMRCLNEIQIYLL